MPIPAATLIAEILAELNKQYMGTGVLSATIEGKAGADGTYTTQVKPKIGSMPIDSGLSKAIATAVGTVISKYLP